MHFGFKKKSLSDKAELKLQLSPAQAASQEQLRNACKGKRRARKALLDRYDPVIIEIAQSFQGDRINRLALIEAGRNGIVQALDLFDSSRDPAEFPPFAKKIIEKNMLMEWKHS
jgi:DNA-directed RNA polymerase specialized sigma subunit